MPEAALLEVLNKSRTEVLEDWVKAQLGAATNRADLIQEDELRAQSATFLQRFHNAAQSGELSDLKAAGVGAGGGATR